MAVSFNLSNHRSIIIVTDEGSILIKISLQRRFASVVLYVCGCSEGCAQSHCLQVLMLDQELPGITLVRPIYFGLRELYQEF